MKTTAKLSLLAAAFLLVLASCTNNFTPTAPAENAFAKNVENKNDQVSTSTRLRVVSISGITRYGDESGYRATVTFSKPVDVESVKKAVHVRQLKPLTEKGNPQLGDELTLEWLTTTVNSEPTTEVNFKIVTTSTMAVYVSVKGDTVKAAGTDQKMDQDRDNEQGESTDSYKGDDDYNEILGLGVTIASSPTSVPGNIYVGNTNYLYTTASGTRKVNTILSGKVSFERGKKADDVNTVVAENGDLVTHVVISNDDWDPNKFYSEEFYGITKEDFEAFVNKHVVVEQFTDKEWKQVTANFVTDTTTTSSSYRKLVAAVSSITENTEMRVRFKDIRYIAVKSSDYEYALRYTTDAHATDNADTTPLIRANSGVKAGVIVFRKGSAFTHSWDADNKVTLTLNPNAFTYYDEEERTITPVLEKDKTYSLSYTGFVPGTLSKDHFKFDGNVTFTAEHTYKETSGISKTFLDYSYTKRFTVRVPLKLVKAPSVSKQVQVDSFSFEPSDISVYPNAANDKLTLTYMYTPFTDDEKEQLKLDGKAFKKALNGLYDSVPYISAYYKYTTYQSDPLTQAFCAEVASAVESTVNAKNQQIKWDNPSWTDSDLISDSEKNNAIYSYVADIIEEYTTNRSFYDYNVTAAPVKATTFPNLYVSPAVKTAAFKGQYNTGKVDADGNAIIKQVDVGEFSFETKRSSFDNQLEKDGWAWISLQ
ncbi:hypothetical protein TREVI0001_0722 [Treponema vincentii ATCC 35580]|uniref:Major fimbrial subunit protein N-terminal domain-containing protein n=1 Tax=Treponema vincentii ATCC 35580 TaxID=596324 RepID=C8PMU5_9SPIR|nr:hypothetical protein [Treponema vincentii]EEV21512.1 hypothetical protein TREVI0001_0722 [Treponema vincentii ATCC 35580]